MNVTYRAAWTCVRAWLRMNASWTVAFTSARGPGHLPPRTHTHTFPRLSNDGLDMTFLPRRVLYVSVKSVDLYKCFIII